MSGFPIIVRLGHSNALFLGDGDGEKVAGVDVAAGGGREVDGGDIHEVYVAERVEARAHVKRPQLVPDPSGYLQLR